MIGPRRIGHNVGSTAEQSTGTEECMDARKYLQQCIKSSVVDAAQSVDSLPSTPCPRLHERVFNLTVGAFSLDFQQVYNDPLIISVALKILSLVATALAAQLLLKADGIRTRSHLTGRHILQYLAPILPLTTFRARTFAYHGQQHVEADGLRLLFRCQVANSKICW